MMLSLFGISKLCLWPRKRNQYKRRIRVWEDNPLWVAAALGDEESIELLLDHGANPNSPGPCALTPSDIATMEEHEGVVRLLLAAGGITHPRVGDLEDGEVGSPTKVDLSNLRLQDVLEVDSTPFQGAPRDGLSEEITDRRSNFQTENPAEARPPDSSATVDLTAQKEPRSSSLDSFSYQIPTFRGPPMILSFVGGGRKELNLLTSCPKPRPRLRRTGTEDLGSSPDGPKNSCTIQR